MQVGDRYTIETLCDDGSIKEQTFEVVEVRPEDGVVIAHLVSE
jgi:hypothetical protein